VRVPKPIARSLLVVCSALLREASVTLSTLR
jgi:hypothetical protein